ncbi:hypothetical protein P7C70_g4635, partial [Phenoliferia sp. Uapishka_3]
MTSITSRALDGLGDAAVRKEVADGLIRYLGTDTVCFHEDYPQQLVALQDEHWKPLIAWVSKTFDVKVDIYEGILGNKQPADTVAKLAAVVGSYDQFKLAAFERAVLASKSYLIALALVEGHYSVDDAAKAAHVEVQSQINKWGEVEDTPTLVEHTASMDPTPADNKREAGISAGKKEDSATDSIPSPSSEDLPPFTPLDQQPSFKRAPTRVTIHSESATPQARPDENAPTKTPSTPFPNLNRSGTGASSNRPYSVFSIHTKWLIVGLGGIAAMLSPISSNIFVPAIPTLVTQFGKTSEEISLAVTIYLVFQAITPSFFGSMSDSFGRRPIYVGTLVVYLGANIGLALCPTDAYWLLMVLRALQATGGSAVVSIGAGAVADVAEPRERGKFMSVFQACFLFASTALGWCLEAHAPLAATLVVNFFVGLGTGTIGTATVYGQDLKPGQGGAVSASLNLVRCLFGAAGTAVVQIIYRAIGAGWTFVLFSGIVILGIPMPLAVLKYAPGWRQKREEKVEAKKLVGIQKEGLAGEKAAKVQV